MKYIGNNPAGIGDANDLPEGSVDSADLSSAVSDKLLGTNNVTLSNLSTSFVSSLAPAPDSGDSGKAIIVNIAEDGYELGAAVGAPKFVTAPDPIGGLTTHSPDGNDQTYTVTGSDSIDPDASSVTYYWGTSQGTLSSSTGTSVNLNFSISEENSNQTLSVYATDDQGNTSDTVNLTIAVDPVVAPSGLVFSLPSNFKINEAEQMDITVGDDGYDPSFTYSWERNFDGAGWVTTGISSATLKNPTLTLPGVLGTVQIRCTVTNSAGSTLLTSGTLDVVDITPDNDSDFVDTDTHTLVPVTIGGTVVNASTINVSGGYELGEGSNYSGNASQDYESFPQYIGNNKFCAIYKDSIQSNNLYYTIGTLVDGVIVWPTPQLVYTPSTPMDMMVDAIAFNGVDKIVCVWRDSGASYYARGISGTISGDSITWGSVNQVHGFNANVIRVKWLTTTKCVCSSNGNSVSMNIGTVSGNNITWGSTASAGISTGGAGTVNLAVIDSTKVVTICPTSGVTPNYAARYVVWDVSGATPSPGTASVLNDTWGANVSSAKLRYLGNNKLIWFRNKNGNAPMVSFIGTISGSTITWEEPQDIPGCPTGNLTITVSSAGKIIIFFYGNLGGYYFIKSIDGLLSGTTMTWKPAITIHSTPNSNPYSIPYWMQEIDSTETYAFFYRQNSPGVYQNSVIVNSVNYFEVGDVVKLPNGNIDTISAIAVGTPEGQNVTLTNETSANGNITRLSSFYTVSPIAQDNGQDPFAQVDLEVQWERNKTTASDVAGDVYIDHGETKTYPFLVGETVVLDGDTEVTTTVTGVSRSTSVGSGTVFSHESHSYYAYKGESVCFITANKALVVSPGGSGIGMQARVATVNSNSMTFGPEYDLNTINADTVGVFRISDTRVLIAHEQKTYFGTFDGDESITWVAGTDLPITPSSNMVLVNNGSTLVFSKTVSDDGDIYAGTIVGETITWGSSARIHTNGVYRMHLEAADNNKVIATWERRDVSPRYGATKIITITGNSCSVSTSVTHFLTNGEVEYQPISYYIGNDKFISSGYQNWVVVGTITGTSIGYGTKAKPPFGTTTYVMFAKIDTDKYMAIDTGSKKACIGTLSGTTFTWGTVFENVHPSTGSPINGDMAASGNLVIFNCNDYVTLLEGDTNDHQSTITVADALPANLTSIEPLPVMLNSDITDSTVTYDDLSETYEMLNNTTGKVTASGSGDGDSAFIRVRAKSTDDQSVNITRIDAGFQV